MKVLTEQPQNACRLTCQLAQSRWGEKGPRKIFLGKATRAWLTVSHLPDIDTHQVTQMFTHTHTTAWNMLFFGEKNTFIFFKYISIDKDSLAWFHYKDEMISQVSKGNFTLTSLWCGFHKVFILKIALNTRGLHLSRSVNSWCPFSICTSSTSTEISPPVPDSLGLANSDESKVLWQGLRLGLSRDAVHPALPSVGPQLADCPQHPRSPSYALPPALALWLGLLVRSLSSASQSARASGGISFRICSTVFW